MSLFEGGYFHAPKTWYVDMASKFANPAGQARVATEIAGAAQQMVKGLRIKHV